jgi:uncharacterized protein with ATP-grasp and redox domains
MTSAKGSFAQYTIIKRKPEIIESVIRDNRYSGFILRSLMDFKAEIATGQVKPLTEKSSDTDFWNREWEKYSGRTWLDLPWYFAETYFYRRLLEAVRYLQEGETKGRDPFEAQKLRELEGRGGAIDLFSTTLGRVAEIEDESDAFRLILHYCLWGNRADLSNIEVAMKAKGGIQARGEEGNILIDHTEEALKAFQGRSFKRVDFINDNFGLELLFDLCLGDLLLSYDWVEKVYFHLKSHPFFVSDAMVKDVQLILGRLERAEEGGLKELAERLADCISEGRFILKDEAFWTTCLHFWDMPLEIEEDLARSDLVILKGDVNYRRLLGDLHWPHTARMEEIASYFPTSFLVLRTLKGEIMVGLKEGQADALSGEDPNWLINGKRGIIQLIWNT